MPIIHKQLRAYSYGNYNGEMVPFGERIASLSVALDSEYQVMFYGGSFYSNIRVS